MGIEAKDGWPLPQALDAIVDALGLEFREKAPAAAAASSSSSPAAAAPAAAPAAVQPPSSIAGGKRKAPGSDTAEPAAFPEAPPVGRQEELPKMEGVRPTERDCISLLVTLYDTGESNPGDRLGTIVDSLTHALRRKGYAVDDRQFRLQLSELVYERSIKFWRPP